MILPVTGLADVSALVLDNTPPQYSGAVIAELGMLNHANPFAATQRASPVTPAVPMEPTWKASGVAPDALRASLIV